MLPKNRAETEGLCVARGLVRLIHAQIARLVRRDSQCIHPFIVGVSGVAFDPMKRDAVKKRVMK